MSSFAFWKSSLHTIHINFPICFTDFWLWNLKTSTRSDLPLAEITRTESRRLNVSFLKALNDKTQSLNVFSSTIRYRSLPLIYRNIISLKHVNYVSYSNIFQLEQVPYSPKQFLFLQNSLVCDSILWHRYHILYITKAPSQIVMETI